MIVAAAAISFALWPRQDAPIFAPPQTGNKRADAGVPKQEPATLTPSDVEEVAPPQPSKPIHQWEVVNESPSRPTRSLASDARPINYNSLPTGTRIGEDFCTGGNGELTVENGTGEDAFVRLSRLATDQTTCWFSVQAHSSAKVTQIPEGAYRLTFTTGLNWVESENTFTWHPTYSEFDRIFEYREEKNSDGVQYKTISVTLNPVPNGNVRTKPITRDEFLTGRRHVAVQLHMDPS